MSFLNEYCLRAVYTMFKKYIADMRQHPSNVQKQLKPEKKWKLNSSSTRHTYMTAL